ncbi:hypothetical protein FRB94_013377 [Tulasnella sp. JGI-2019a]|nr:hypothetical protein FRB94_013377 [Tulasnella sp. JGI-2019a]
MDQMSDDVKAHDKHLPLVPDHLRDPSHMTFEKLEEAASDEPKEFQLIWLERPSSTSSLPVKLQQTLTSVMQW